MGHSIYLADDEKSIRELLHSFLASDGYTVRSFESGDALLEAFRQEPAELVILDIMMPGTDGLTVCRELRTLSDIPIILLTAKDSELDYVMGISQGSDDYLTKPFRPTILLMKVKALLRRVVEQYAAKASEKGLSLQLQDTDAFAVFDFKWTAEALANIVDNAIKYTEHGTITISAVSYEMFARIDISDTGSGIPETEQAKIFARFYRSNSVQKQEGVGIGLYLARQIISGEGGYIKVASVPGKGSTFSIFLPK